MADRYENFDRTRERDRGHDRDRNWERERDQGHRFDENQQDYRPERYGVNREYDQQERQRNYDRENWRGENQGSEGGYYNRYNPQTSEYGQGSREDWRARSGQSSQGWGGGMGAYSRQDWRTQQGSYAGGMGEGFGRSREYGERGSGDYRGNQGTSYGQGQSASGSYGPDEFRTGSRGSYSGRGSYTAEESGMYQTGRFTGKGPKGYQRSDERIREDVCERLTQHPEIDASEIDVRVNSGEVTLNGTVDDRHQKRTVEDVIEAIFGVREVNNQLKVSRNFGQRSGEALGSSGRESDENRATTGTTGASGRQNEPATARR